MKPKLKRKKNTSAKPSSPLPPITHSFQGSLKNKNINKEDYKKWLEHKHK